MANRRTRTQVASGIRPPHARASLIVQTGKNQGLLVEITRARASIGRDATASVSLDDDQVSRFHAEVRVTDEGWTLFDLGSTNGTRVNDEVVTTAPLHHGDRIGLGNSVLRFLLEDVEDEHVYRIA